MKGFFQRKHKKDNIKTDAAVNALNLLLNDKVEQMATIDALITILIQAGIFTKTGFDQVKNIIKESEQYQKIFQLTDRLAESLDPESVHARLTDEELDELITCLNESELGE